MAHSIALGAALAQTAPVIRSTTQLVQVDVVGEDKDGKPVANLRKEDFQLFIDRKQHSIDTFAASSDEPATTFSYPRGMFSNTHSAEESSRGRYIVFLLDWRNTEWSGQAFSRDQLKIMLPSMPADARVALYLLNNGFQIVQEFTSDKVLLESKVESLLGSPPTSRAGSELDQAELQARDTVYGFQAIARHLAGITGQKRLLWVTTGFPDKAMPTAQYPTGYSFPDYIDDAVRILGNSNVVVEAINACGLAAGKCKSYPDTMQQIAERTGGLLYSARNDLDVAMREAMDDRRTSYQLGFYASDETGAAGRSVEIRTGVPGITLRYREMHASKPPGKTKAEVDPAKELLLRAMDASAIPLTANVTRSIGNAASMTLHLTVGASALSLVESAATWRGKVSMTMRFASEDGTQIGESPFESRQLSLPKDAYDKALRDGIRFTWAVKVPQGADSLRVLVRDEGSGVAGTVTIQLSDLPER